MASSGSTRSDEPVTTVVKIGGATGNDPTPVLREIAGRRDCILVHGGSADADGLAERIGRPVRTFVSPSGVVSRRTDAAQLEVIIWAIAGGVQTRLVSALNAAGARAVGLSGVDGATLLARRKEGTRAVEEGRVVRIPDDRSGTIEHADPTAVLALLSAGFVPVIGPPAITASGEVVNVDADRAAAAIAVAVGASHLALLTNVPGLLRDPEDPASIVPEVSRDRFDEVAPWAHGRMKKKLLAAREALVGGVRTVTISASQREAPIAHALAGEGTTFR